MSRNLSSAVVAAAVVAGTGLLAGLAALRLDVRWIDGFVAGTVLVGVLLLHRRRDPDVDSGMSPSTWRAFDVAGIVLVLTTAVDLALEVAGAFDDADPRSGLPLAVGTLLAAGAVFQGLVRWNAHCRHVLTHGRSLTTLCAVSVVAGAGDLLVPHLAPAVVGWAPWQRQVWLLTVAATVVLAAAAVVVARTAGLRRDSRIWSLAGALGALVAIDASIAVVGSSGFLALRAAAAAAVVVLGTAVLRSRTPEPALVRGTVPVTGALAVLGTAVAVLVTASWSTGTGTSTAALWALLAVVGSGFELVRMTGALSELAEARLQARTDDLTGLGNRRWLVGQLDELARDGHGAAVLKLDLDDFGLVNERLGQHGGDDVLRLVARTVRATVPATALTARTGGDTFAVVLPRAREDDAVRLAARLDEALRALPPTSRLGRPLAASTGLAAVAAGELSGGDLMRRAGAALAVAKTGPRGLACYDAGLDRRTRERAALTVDLQAALADPALRLDQFLLHYQPQVDVTTGAVVGVEALVRWRHPGLGPLSPDRFLDLVEEAGLMGDLTAHVLDRAVREVGAWGAAAGPLRVSVNLSAGSLADGTLLPLVDAVLARYAFDPARLVLEVTETTLMSDPELAVAVTGDLVARGVALSIDDYGTGYSSLAYLSDLPASELKLDRSFTLRVGSEPRTAAIVEGTVALAHRLGLRVIAEGVEDLHVLGVLRDLGVDETQGYLHARPLEPSALRAWLDGHAPGVAPLPA